MEYEKPIITDLGSISEHTWRTPGGRVKGGQLPNAHLDKFCELSGCYSPTDPDCINNPICAGN